MMKNLLLIVLVVCSTTNYSFSQSTTDTLEYSYGEYVDTYWYSVFKNGTKEIMFYNPNMQPYGDGMGHILDELKDLPFTIKYTPWSENDSYCVMESISTNLDGILPKFIDITQPAMDEMNLIYQNIDGTIVERPMKNYSYLKFNGENVFVEGPMVMNVNSDVLEKMKQQDVYFIAIIQDWVSVSDWLY